MVSTLQLEKVPLMFLEDLFGPNRIYNFLSTFSDQNVFCFQIGNSPIFRRFQILWYFGPHTSLPVRRILPYHVYKFIVC